MEPDVLLELPPPRRAADVRTRLTSEVRTLEQRGGGRIRLVLPEVDDREDDLVEEFGFVPGRDRWRMRVEAPSTSTNLRARPWSPADVGMGAALEAAVPDWRFPGVDPSVALEGEGSHLLMVHIRQGTPRAFARAYLGASAELYGYGIVPGTATNQRALPIAIVTITVNHLERLGYRTVTAEVDPADFERSTVLEGAGFRYLSATRSYDRVVDGADS